VRPELHPGAGRTLAGQLFAAGVEFPCGGQSACGGCRVWGEWAEAEFAVAAPGQRVAPSYDAGVLKVLE